MKNTILILGAAIAVVIFTYFSFSLEDGMFLEENQRDSSILRGILLACAMLLGIVAGRVHKLISLQDEFSFGELRSGIFQDKELWKSLLASPIVFGVVYSMLAEFNDNVVSLIFSFQNGFFCNVILDKRRAEIEDHK